MSEITRTVIAIFLCMGAYILGQRLAMRYVAHARYPGKHTPPIAGDTLAALVGAQIFCFFILITARPWMSVILSLSLMFLLLVLNRVKEQVLHEPLVLADAYLLPQVWKFPEMYFPFMPVKPMLCGALATALGLGLMLYWEPSLSLGSYGAMVPVLLGFLIFPVLGVVLLRYCPFGNKLSTKLLKILPISHDATADAMRNGPLAAAYLQPIQAGHILRTQPDFLQSPQNRPQQSHWPEKFEQFLTTVGTNNHFPHVVLIQAESFADIRPRLSAIQQEVLKDFLPNWERLQSQGRVLPTPPDAYGAYTMRTEFSMLTGLKMSELGVFAHNPYILAARKPLWSLARFFSQKGYTSTCLHPYHKSFFQRDKVMPHLGFDSFEGIEELHSLPKFGPYTSDKALVQNVLERIATSPHPTFHFVISIEAHGPWQRGRLTGNEIHNCLGDSAQLFSDELQIYLCHLKHMDEIFGLLMDLKETTLPPDPAEHIAIQRPTELWVYSDHEPSLRV